MFDSYFSLTLQKWHTYTRTFHKNVEISSASLTPYLENENITTVYITIDNNKTSLCELIPSEKENEILNFLIEKDKEISISIDGKNDVDLLFMCMI